MSDVYTCKQMLNLDNHLYQVGETIAASVFDATTLAPETPEQCIARLVDAGVLAPAGADAQQVLSLEAQLQQVQAERDAMQAELDAMRVILPASAAQRMLPSMRNPEQAPAASGTDGAPISE